MKKNWLDNYKCENGGKLKAKPGTSLGPAPTSQDSLDVYNSSVNNLKYYRDRGYKETKPVYDLSHDTFHMLDSTADDFKKANGFTTYPTSDGHTFVQDKLPLSQYRQDIDANKFKQREISTRIIDTRAPMVQYDRRIKPSATYTFTNTNPNDPMYQDTAIIPGYDPVAVKPDALLSPEERALRNNRYGKGTPAPKPHPTENIHTLDTYGAKLLPTNIQQSDVQQIDPTEGINYSYQGNGVFVPDDFHKRLGYANKTQYKDGGKIKADPGIKIPRTAVDNTYAIQQGPVTYPQPVIEHMYDSPLQYMTPQQRFQHDVATSYKNSERGLTDKSEDRINNWQRKVEPASELTGKLLEAGFAAEGVEQLAKLGAKGAKKIANAVSNSIVPPSFPAEVPMMTDVTPMSGVKRNYKDVLFAQRGFGKSDENSLLLDHSKDDLFGIPRYEELRDFNSPTPYRSRKDKLKDIAFQPEKIDAVYKKHIEDNNTFVRGVSTNWDAIKNASPEGFENITKTLEAAGIDWEKNPQAAATYMATHVPGRTGYGRVGLNQGEHALYTSNSEGTASGYTYGDGYIVKGRRPLKFEGNNRQQWVKDNNADILTDWDKQMSDPYNVRNNFEFNMLTHSNPSEVIGLNKELAHEFFNTVKEKEKELYKKIGNGFEGYTNHGDHPTIGPFSQRPDGTIPTSVELGDIENELKSFKKNIYEKNFQHRLKMPEPLDTKGKILKTENHKYNPYSHYLFMGEPGEKVLDPIEVIRVSPETWESKSRGHSGVYTRGLSKYKQGGKIKNKWLDNYKC